MVVTLDPPWAWKPRPTLWIHCGLWLRCVHPFGIKWSPPVTRHPMLHTLVKHVSGLRSRPAYMRATATMSSLSYMFVPRSQGASSKCSSVEIH